jgi:hypothetical protein
VKAEAVELNSKAESVKQKAGVKRKSKVGAQSGKQTTGQPVKVVKTVRVVKTVKTASETPALKGKKMVCFFDGLID